MGKRYALVANLGFAGLEPPPACPARPGALAVVAELAALDVAHVAQEYEEHDTRRSMMPGSR
jgi:hypothetical protein